MFEAEIVAWVQTYRSALINTAFGKVGTAASGTGCPCLHFTEVPFEAQPRPMEHRSPGADAQRCGGLNTRIVDINRITETRRITEDQGGWRIGDPPRAETMLPERRR